MLSVQIIKPVERLIVKTLGKAIKLDAFADWV
jgi:hypothetical protein